MLAGSLNRSCPSERRTSAVIGSHALKYQPDLLQCPGDRHIRLVEGFLFQ